MAEKGFSIDRFVRQTTKSLQDEKWRPLLLSLTALSALTASYKAYTGIRTQGLGEDDLFPDFTATIQEMITAKRHPEEVFYFLPESRLRAQVFITAAQHLGNRKLVPALESPIIHAYEWQLLGGLSLQQVTIENPGTEGPEGLTDISRHHALIGEKNSLIEAYYLDSPQRGMYIDKITAQYPAGARALEARRNLTGR